MKLDAKLNYVEGQVQGGKPCLTLALTIQAPLEILRAIEGELEGEDNIRVELFKVREEAI